MAGILPTIMQRARARRRSGRLRARRGTEISFCILRCCPARLGQELQLRKVITQHYGPDSLSEAQIQTVIAQLKAQRAQLEKQVRLV